MGAWAGRIHELVELRSLRRLRESPIDQSTFTHGLSGRRRARVAPSVSRSWSCEVAMADPAGLATLEEFYWAHRGEPLWLVTEAARVQNVLPPPGVEHDRAREVLVPKGWKTGNAETFLAAAGPVATVDGVAAASVLVTGGGQARLPIVPVLPGVPFTISAYVNPGGTLGVAWMQDGVTQSVSASSAPAGALVDGALQRAFLTLTPAPGQTAVQLRGNAGVTTIARPQLTWTPGVVPYVPGRGAEKVIFGPLNQDVQALAVNGARNLSSFTYTIQEVG